MVHNRNLNVIVFGILENCSDVSRSRKWLSDLQEVSDLFSKSPLSVPVSSISGCHRLGKFLPTNNRPRPIMVQFNSCSIVVIILKNRSSFTPFIVKLDLDPNERATEKILLHERWQLIKSGINKGNIKIGGNRLVVNGSICGIVKDSTFVPTSASQSSDTQTNFTPCLLLLLPPRDSLRIY